MKEIERPLDPEGLGSTPAQSPLPGGGHSRHVTRPSNWSEGGERRIRKAAS